jgi:hypothetical protein
MRRKYESFKMFDNTKYGTIQIAFCCDVTGSMDSYILGAKETILKIQEHINKMKFCRYEFAFVAYRDHCDKDRTFLTKSHDFDSKDVIKNFIDGIDATGGGDYCEAVLVGLNDCVEKLSWKTNAVKFVFHITDAPPHGDEYSNSCGDDYPGGCPLGLTVGEISQKFKYNEIKYILLDCSDDDELDDMVRIFKKNKNFGKFPIKSLDTGVSMLKTVSTCLKKAFEAELGNFKERIKSMRFD